MEKLSKIGRYEFLAEPFHCDFSNHLFMGHLGNHMLNAADFHSNDRGYGMNYLNTVNKTWVLSRLAIEMEEMPKAYDKFFVETWVDSALKSFTSRNFKVIGETGHVYGYGKSVWAMIDLDTRQPADILAVRGGLITEYIETEYSCPIEKSSRVKMSADATPVRSIDTYYKTRKSYSYLLTKRNKNMFTRKPIREYLQRFIHNGPKPEATHSPFKR